ncbi:hypothetical protein Nepgr_019737 [Nepenthes gracilis]|uniref:RING-type E3 ubiquitin transferase n=1 Tax=Nepenthes gracilis TaxID=150966 RepID=A0AAD3XVM5_NEPGR|nr:hypothetical protein Nepgr_019737 [Nepenthes gracilis]
MGFSNRKLFLEGSDSNYAEKCRDCCDCLSSNHAPCPPKCFDFNPSVCAHYVPSLIPNPEPYRNNPPLQSNHHHHHHPSPLLISMLILLASTFLLVSFYVIYKKFYAHIRGASRRRPIINPDNQIHEHDDHHHQDFLDEEHVPVVDNPIWHIATVGLQPSIISSITVCRYRRGEGLVESTDCAVCLTEFQEDDILRLLPKCNHAFHIPCIDTWLISHTNCPLCRAPIISIAANAPSPLSSSADNSISMENPHVENPENNGNLGRDLRINSEEEGELAEENEPMCCDKVKKEGNEVKSIRRAVSVQFISGSSMIQALSNSQLVELGEEFSASNGEIGETGSSSSSSSSSILQKGPALMGRSMSCSGNLLSRNGGEADN